MSKTVTFTRQLVSDAIDESTAVDEVYYNDNTRELYVDLDPGNIYKYSNVPPNVADEFERVKSAGSFYATVIKRNYGPGEDLGKWSSVVYDEVEKETPKLDSLVSSGSVFATGGLIVGPGTAPFKVDPNRQGIPNTAPAQFSLKPFSDEVKVEGVERTYIVTFEVEGLVDFRRHTLTSTSVDEAVKTVLDLGKALDLKFIAREVTIKFE